MPHKFRQTLTIRTSIIALNVAEKEQYTVKTMLKIFLAENKQKEKTYTTLKTINILSICKQFAISKITM